ncbi:peptide deformylase [Paenibacillus sp. 481]|uniref:peptide deformylase n=1 Tax=Paenibacillus sp. 481 TaxID=2835869 RepID=UPI001E5186B1|nr:peptide deformylase [Paenibacillus sp. 481]UHA74036.1 peptide deformylase [Paenibacillus sp. 481]
MALRIIVHEPDPVLHERAKEVTKIAPNIHKLLNDMADTMYHAEGVGLAAPQIGILKRVIVVDVGDEHGLIEMINPVMTEMTGEQLGPEGCLSIPGINGDVRRHQQIKVTGLNRNGKEFSMVVTDFLARAFQHEIDHLNGVLFTEIADRVYDAPRHDKE